MKLWSDNWTNGDPIPQRYAAGRPDGKGQATFGDNFNPHLAWSDLPSGTQSLALICHDFDVPSRAQDLNRGDREVPVSLERVDFFHWVLVDLPTLPTCIAEGQYSRGFTPGGKPGHPVRPGAAGGRQGLNDFTGWFADRADLRGQYFGYDGPFPPFNDSLVHHYGFTLYAVALPTLPLPEPFTGLQARAALAGHVLAEATLSGTYTLNPRLGASWP